MILGFNVMLLILLEVPLAGYFVAPERTVVEVQRFRAWLTRRGRRDGGRRLRRDRPAACLSAA